jgi:RNA recognition motif-containing protein
MKLYSARQSQTPVNHNMKLLIRNLARTTTEQEVRAMFEVHGSVQSCNLVMDSKTGSSKGFGFVEMPKPGEAKAAIKVLNGKDIGGSKIRVKKQEPKQELDATNKE